MVRNNKNYCKTIFFRQAYIIWAREAFKHDACAGCLKLYFLTEINEIVPSYLNVYQY